jgi:hypothetical protein
MNRTVKPRCHLNDNMIEQFLEQKFKNKKYEGYDEDKEEMIRYVMKQAEDFRLSGEEVIDEILWICFVKQAARENEESLSNKINQYMSRWENSGTESIMKRNEKKIIYLVNLLFVKSGGNEAEMREIREKDWLDDEEDIHNEHELRVALQWYKRYKERNKKRNELSVVPV